MFILRSTKEWELIFRFTGDSQEWLQNLWHGLCFALVAEGASHRPAAEQSFLSLLYFVGREPGAPSKLSPWEQGQSGDDSKAMGRSVVTRHVCQVWSQISLVQACGPVWPGPRTWCAVSGSGSAE